ncbi:MAG: alpha/beta fold hydrolase [Planctomycetales bacterium]|nr:alpha/beta fold hydrolase [Planctomycetales bacterium]
MNRMHTWLIYVAMCFLCLHVHRLAAQVDSEEIHFVRHNINSESEFSAAAALDVNRDGQLDIVCGAWWYRAPDWKKFHLREVEQIRGRFDDYSNLTLDVDLDGDLDIVSVNYRSQSLYWCRNPGDAVNLDMDWERIEIDRPGSSETGRLVDIDRDGRLDVLPSGTNFAAWYACAVSQVDGKPMVTWQKFDLPEELIGHGIGAGDINGDGRVDLVCPRGWAEGPNDPRKERWIWHPDFQLARDCGLPILCHDVDGDGDTDLIWGRGHNIGVYWTEQKSPAQLAGSSANNSILLDNWRSEKWETHAIDTSWSAAHTLMMADIDGDSALDLVVGKRFQGHDGKDPGENDPLEVHWYRFEKQQRVWSRHLVHAGSNVAIDLDSQCVDLDQDGDIDILAPSRCGLSWLENQRVGASDASQRRSAEIEPEYLNHRDVDYYVEEGEQHPITNALEHGLRRQHILQNMQRVMGTLPDSSFRVPLDIRMQQVEEEQRYYRIHITFQSDPYDRVPAYLLVPKDIRQPCPAMLCLHPTHFELGKAQLCGLGGQPSRFYAHELADRGYVCLVPDYPGFGEYSYDFAQHHEYASGTMKAIWNNIRALDVLESLTCVKPDKIGCIGHSLGGHNALFSAAFDLRIRCVVSSCGFNAFEDYYGGNLKGWTSDRYMPRIASVYDSQPEDMPFDFPEVLAAIVPRPLFVNAPIHDENFAVEGVRKCESSVAPLYQLLNNAEAAHFAYPDYAHDFPIEIRDQVYQWLKEQL